MHKRWLTSITLGLVAAISLTGCNTDTDDNIGPDDVNYSPVRYDNNDMMDNDYDLDRGLDLDSDGADMDDNNEMDTPFNMDEEEPDLDEEPSEQRRGY
jgi:hypothetical protein